MLPPPPHPPAADRTAVELHGMRADIRITNHRLEQLAGTIQVLSDRVSTLSDDKIARDAQEAQRRPLWAVFWGVTATAVGAWITTIMRSGK